MRKLALLAVAFALFARAAGATETQWWTTNTQSDHTKAETRGVVVRADGTLVPGPRSTSYPADSLRNVWAILALRDGSVAIAGDRGRIDRWTEQGGVRPWVRLGAGQVLSLAADGDGLVAGTGPRGLVYRVSAKGDTSLLARTGERYVWGLAASGSGQWYAATGTRGKLMKLVKGEAITLLDTEESNLVSLVADGKGGAFAGGDSKGRIYHVVDGGAGTLRTAFDAGEDEIRALALGPDGALWAAALSGSAVSDEGSGDDAGPTPVKTPPTGARAVVYRVVSDSAAASWWVSPQPLVYALAFDGAQLMVGTGNRAGVHRLEGVNRAATLLSPAQGQVTALAPGSGGAFFAATSNPAALWRLGPGTEAGWITSSVFDARRFANYGRVALGGTAARIWTRTGNSDTPDTTWSPWRATSSGGAITSPAGRYFQWKLDLANGSAVDEVRVSWREQNLAPRIDDLSVTAQGQNFREGELSPRSEAVTQTLSSGQRVEYSATIPSNKAIRELPLWARGLRTLQWHASDPNGDPLRYRVEVQSLPDGAWIEIGKDLEAALYTWNTNTLPDGRYRVRVTVTDEPGNAVGEGRSADATSEPFTVDNSPPTVTSLSGIGEPGAARVQGEAQDERSPIARVEVAVDDGPWRPMTPDGGFADELRETFHARLGDLTAGEHLVSVRAVDSAGNAATKAARVIVPKPR